MNNTNKLVLSLSVITIFTIIVIGQHTFNCESQTPKCEWVYKTKEHSLGVGESLYLNYPPKGIYLSGTDPDAYRLTYNGNLQFSILVDRWGTHGDYAYTIKTTSDGVISFGSYNIKIVFYNSTKDQTNLEYKEFVSVETS